MPRPKALNDEEKAKVWGLLQAGYKQKWIAIRMQCAAGTIRNVRLEMEEKQTTFEVK